MSTPNSKEVVYIDIDDEITSIIDKVRSANGKLIALVLPKRATMLQSSVNMKLLKRGADSANKNVVLITSERGLLPLAGSVGLYVAKTLQSKPELPSASAVEAEPALNDLIANDEPEEEFDNDKAAKKPVGELAGIPEAEAVPATAIEADEAMDLDNSDDAKDATEDASKKKKDKTSKNKKLKVPNFERFRLRLILAAVLIIILVVGWILADIVLPKAAIVIDTKASNVSSNLTLNLDTTAKSLNTSSLTVPAQNQQVAKTSSAQVSTTGQENEGNKATGNVVFTTTVSCLSGQPQPITSNLGISYNNLTFITQSGGKYSETNLNKQNQTCTWTTNDIAVGAQSPGSASNLPSGTTFTVPGNSNVTAQSDGNFTGGTDTIVQTVAQADIDSATQKITAPDSATIKTALQNDLQQAGLMPITATFSAGAPSDSPSAQVGTQASTVTVTQSITYSMLGVNKSYLQTLINSDVNSQINTNKQSILDDGVNNAAFTLLNSSANGAQVTMQATASVGSKLDITAIKNEIEGKKPGDVKTIIEGNPGVTNVTVKLSPFFVSSVPKNTSKITVQIEKSS